MIVPVQNYASVTRSCLDLLVEQTPEAIVEIIVVDVGSTDATPAVLEGYGRRVRGVSVDAGSGIARARNAGAAVASHRDLLFFDVTTVPRPGWLEPLLQDADAHSDAAVLGGKLLDARDAVIHAGVVICQDRLPRPLYRGFPADHPGVNRSRAHQIVSGGYVLVTREAFGRAGGFDPSFDRIYYDEDLCLRLRTLGYHARYCHESVAHRLNVVDSNGESPDGDRALFRARWGHRVRADDFDYYMRDGLLRVGYDRQGPLRLHVSPLLASVDESAHATQAGRLLAERAQQVQALTERTATLTARVRELESGGASTIGPFSQAVASAVVAAEGYRKEEPVDGELMPPEALSISVGGRFREEGEEFFRYCLEIGGLRATDRVLDIGCGVGRMAVKLAPFLRDGSYEGFDIRADVIDWCKQHITPRYPHARFTFVDIANGYYNSRSAQSPSTFRFPYSESSFDFVLLKSVFTHMLPADLQHYAAEIVAALKPGGTCFCTFFLLNAESFGLMRAGMSGVYSFTQRSEGYHAIYPNVPESAVAYQEDWIRGVYRSNGLRIIEPIRYGGWCGRQDGLSLQDIVIAVKERAPA